MGAIPVSRFNDTGSGHGSFPPTNINSASTNVYINGKGAARSNDTLVPHSSPSPSPQHNRVLGKGSVKTFVNGRSVIRIGDPIVCGGLMVQGSGDVKKG